MKLVIMRHGDAAFSNSDRNLSETGRKEVSTIAYSLANVVRIDRCLCSPKTRAVQTANILKDKVFYCDIEIEKMLTPSGDPAQIISYLDSIIEPDKNLLIVSHLPLVELLAYELNKKIAPPPVFDTACALLIDYDGEIARFETYLSPYHGIKVL